MKRNTKRQRKEGDQGERDNRTSVEPSITYTCQVRFPFHGLDLSEKLYVILHHLL